MSIKENYEQEWDKFVEQIFELDEDFDWKQAKKLSKSLSIFERKLERKREEIITTLELTDFNEKKEVKLELEDTVLIIDNYLVLLGNITKLEASSQKGYYNYIKNAVGYLD